MNYYEHHIGDYDSATAHLSAVEDGIYSRLIRRYMATEKPLPGDIKAIQRLVRAHNREEKNAVASVLAEFFSLRDGEYFQHRCDEEIERFQRKSSKAKTSAEARWNKGNQLSEGEQKGDANAYANASPKHGETHVHGECEGNAPRARPQSPDTKHQTLIQGNSTRSAQSPPAPRTPAAGVCLAVRQAGLASCNPSDPRLQALLDRGATVEQFVAAVPQALGKRSGWPYLLAVIEGQLTDAAQLAQGPRATPGQQAPPRPPTAAEARRQRNAEVAAELSGRRPPPPPNPERTSHADPANPAIDVESRVL